MRHLKVASSLMFATLVLGLGACAPSVSRQQPSAAALDLARTIEQVALSQPVTELKVDVRSDSSVNVGGRLNGRLFSARFPPDWNHQSVLYAHGYTLPSDKPDYVAADLIAQDDTVGLTPAAYRERFAVARSVYDKRGFAVQSGIENTYQLKLLMDAFGSTADYITGASMGGSVLMGLIEKHPNAFIGALSACGAVSDWEYQVRYLTDFRALYIYFTRGTPYALPGSTDLRRSPTGLKADELLKPMGQLFFKATLNPKGPEARLIQLIASSVPDAKVTPDITSFFNSIGAQLFGLDDITATAGGLFTNNLNTVYSSPLLSTQENAALNAGIERYSGETPAALAYAREWYSSTGHFQTKLLTYHNTSDSLVPFEHEARLRARVEAAGNTANLAQQQVKPKLQTLSRILFWKLEGVEHCGFTAPQNAYAFHELIDWVQNGQRPQDRADITDVKFP